MPKVISYTPAWLAKPQPGYQLFTESSKPTSTAKSNNKRSSKHGPRRTIARRGNTEVFIAVGTEIRWADLAYLKGAYEHKQATKGPGKYKRRDSSESQYEADTAQGYRTLRTSAAEEIRQLVISPQENYMAILTTHTVHIAILPDSSQLTAADSSPMKMKTMTLGPTTHVTSQPGIVSALWHPLGVNGTCLVTVTEDAVVRVWELSISNYSSFDRPTLAIDLKKLADGTSLDQDFGASVSGVNKAFSPDSFEMEVASACFAGRRSGGWSPMTLWIAMREGDVYALCPLLPEKWSPPPTLIPSLSISVVANIAVMEDDPTIPQQKKLLAQQQLQWMSEIDSQEPYLVEAPPGEPAAEVYTRPGKPGRVPRLQGPFDFEFAPEESEEEGDGLLSDILVIGGKLDAEELMFGEEDDLDLAEADQEGLSVSVVCVLTSSGRLSICLDLEGIEAQWLPKSKSKAIKLLEELESPSLLTFEVMDVSRNAELWEGSWPLFSPDSHSRYKFFITNTSSVTFIDLGPWVSRLESELNDSSPGSNFRIDLLAKSQSSLRERLYTQKPLDPTAPLTASVVIRDPDVGYFLLTATPYSPLGLTFEDPDPFIDFRRSITRSPTYESDPEQPLALYEPRPPFEPAHVFEEGSTLPQYLEKLEHSRFKRLVNEEVRLSPATLQILTEAHKVVSEETHRIGSAAAEVFRRCVRLQLDLKSHINKAKDVAARVEAVTEVDDEDGPSQTREENINRRIQAASQRQQELAERVEKLKRKVARGTGRELSDKERAWMDEVKTLEKKVLGTGEDNDATHNSKEPWARYEEVRHLKDELLEQVQDLTANEKAVVPASVKVPGDIRKAKLAQIQSLLERETALVDATKGRLENLKLMS